MSSDDKAAAAAARLLEIASTLEPQPDGRVYVELINGPFLREGGRPDDYRAGIQHLKESGMIDMHRSGAFFHFTEKGASKLA
jgi:hypothetical protein